MLTLIRHHNLPLYQKQVGSKLLYAHHAYHVHPHDVEIRFTFLADETNFRYQLQCYYDGQPLSLSEQKPVIVLTSSPSALLLGMELYFFPHIESVRILPFTKKKKISVPASQIEKYIDNIVIPIARYHEITTQGLNIIEETYTCEAVLSLEDTIYDEQMLRLSFRYGDQSFTPDTVTEMKKIIYRNDFGEIFFFRRDSDAEEEKLRMLTDSGLVAPCVLWIDEIEKGLSGIQSSGSTDGGVTSRIFSTILTWMQEKTSPVFVVATANNINQLPPKLLRKGRFDEIFFVDLPSKEERKNIFTIHLNKKGQNPIKNNYPMESLANNTEGFNGAEIEECIKEAMFDAYVENPENPQLKTTHLMNAISKTVPLSTTMKEQISALRRWAKTRAKNASIEYTQEDISKTEIYLTRPELELERSFDNK